MTVTRKKFIMFVDVDLNLDDAENVDKVINWYYTNQVDKSLKIKIKHIRGNKFKVFYNSNSDDLVDETKQVIAADPDEDDNYPLEITVDGITKFYPIHGEVKGLDY